MVSKNSEDVPLGIFRSLVCSERDSWSRAPKREAFSAMALMLRAVMGDGRDHDSAGKFRWLTDASKSRGKKSSPCFSLP